MRERSAARYGECETRALGYTACEYSRVTSLLVTRDIRELNLCLS